MANEPSKESSLFPDSSGEKEDSGLMDILSVASSMKDGDEEEEDSGVLLFTSGDEDGGSGETDDDALFGSFGGGLGGGFGEPEPEPEPELAAPPLGAGTSLADQVIAESVATPAAATSTAAATPAPAKSEGENRTPLIIVAAVLGLAIVGGGIFMMTRNQDGADQQAQAEVEPVEDAAVGNVEEPVDEQDAAGAAAVAPQPEPEPVTDTEGLDTDGFDTEGYDTEGDPLATKEGMLDGGGGGGSKGGKWNQGTSYQKDGGDGEAKPEPKVEDDPLPLTGGGGGGGKVSEEDVDCLLNPDMPKCAGGGVAPTKEKQVLKPKIPEKLTQAQLRSGMGKVKGNAKKCGLKHGVPPGTVVQLHVSVEGATGTVSAVNTTGEYAGTALGKCVEDAAKKATFEEFKTAQMGFDFPMIM